MRVCVTELGLGMCRCWRMVLEVWRYDGQIHFHQVIPLLVEHTYHSSDTGMDSVNADVIP